jgi:uncharacterized membrane protein YdjX (TVP38/TMEM64 family)
MNTQGPLVKKTKIVIVILILSLVILFYATGTYEQLDLAHIQSNLDKIRAFHHSNPLSMILLFMSAYIAITAMSIPGAIVLTLLAGAVFGVWKGTILVSLASTIGATIAFLMSRYLFKESMMNRFRNKMGVINRKLKEGGNHYLFTLRLIPVSPFVVVNLMMGLTHVSTWSFIWITFVGMFPGNLVYVYAGRKIAEIKSPSEILTLPIILILTFLGLLPLILKKLISTSEDKTRPLGENYGRNHR